jgi:RsiW-degrading membrane proteinase PrsW (M82 family)
MTEIAILSSTLIAFTSLSNTVGSVLFYLLIGVAPCLLWLFFYLLQDRHPEPKKEILAVFSLGAAMTIPATAMELFLKNIIGNFNLSDFATAIIFNVIGVALIEEFFKYEAFWRREQAIKQNRHLDEPPDFVIYMVASAMGFATIENILYLLMPSTDPLMMRLVFRAITAIFLHTLSSGILGYFIAIAFCRQEKKVGLMIIGFIIVSCLHGLYNFSIMESENNLSFLLIPLAILLLMAITLYIQFQQLLRMKSVCTMTAVPKPKIKSRNRRQQNARI